MKKLNYLILLSFLLSSCNSLEKTKISNPTDQRIEWLKDYSFCKCLDTSLGSRLNEDIKEKDHSYLLSRLIGYQDLILKIDTIKSISSKINIYLRPVTESVIKKSIKVFKIEIIDSAIFNLEDKNSLKTRFTWIRNN